MSPFLLLPFLVCAVLATANSDIDVDLILKQHHQVLQSILSTLQMRGPQRAVNNFDLSNQALQNCFDYIGEKQTEDLSAYQDGKKACRKASSNSKNDVSRRSNDKRNELLESGNKAGSRLKDCEGITDGLQFFTCYSQAAESSSQDLRNISLVSNDEVGSLNILYQQINIDHDKCDSTCATSYASALANTNEEMQNCFKGTFVPPSGTNVDPSTESTTVVSTDSTSVASTEPESSSVVSTDSSTAGSPESSTTEPQDNPNSFHGSEAYPEEDIDDTHLPLVHMIRWKMIKKMYN